MKGLSLKHHNLVIAGESRFAGGIIEVCEDSPDWRIILRSPHQDVIDTMRFPPESIAFLREALENAEIGQESEQCLDPIRKKAENRLKSP